MDSFYLNAEQRNQYLNNYVTGILWAKILSDSKYNTIASSTNKVVYVDVTTCLSANHKTFDYLNKGNCVTAVRNFPLLPFRESITVYIV